MPKEFKRYQRQIILPEIGVKGQKKLQNAKVLCIGAGGLGSPILLYLAAAGVGTLGIMDPDKIALSNLHRQVLFKSNQLGLDKATVAASHLQLLNTRIKIIPYVEKLTVSNAIERMQDYDIVIDATDNFSAKYLINDCAAKLGIPMVYGAIMGYEGQAAVFWSKHGACYRCLFPQPPQIPIASCAEFGIIGSIAGIIGSIQAMETIKLILQHTSLKPRIGKIAMLDAANMEMQTYQLGKNKECAICSCTPEEIKFDIDNKEACYLDNNKIQFVQYKELFTMTEDVIIDVRESFEWEQGHIPGAQHLPLSTLSFSTDSIESWNQNKKYIFYCQKGICSQQAAEIFLNSGFQHVAYLRGGLSRYKSELEFTVM